MISSSSRRTADQVRMSGTPGAYRQLLVPRGSQRPEWLPVA
ncbi:hypothetical protein [Streptomyces griseoluteus]|nr:hypothetical protein [Streptomyces griseoluteus]